MDRKIVKPALPGGRIFNPEHNNFLPDEGIEVAMSPFWIGLERDGNVIATDPAPVEAPEPAAPTTPAA